ncbi:MAG TPA: hypothetical protein VEQ42_09680 [Pyrinomonadaceae bacterium]|nr:hypothetical protein [Pyrinomonadaceae bacterium]
MHLIQILLPLYDNEGRAFGGAEFDRVRNELADRFGGVTAFRRAPAEGVWKDDGGEVSRDRIVIFEVMADRLERAWWAGFRAELERRFAQDEIVIRATPFERI